MDDIFQGKLIEVETKLKEARELIEIQSTFLPVLTEVLVKISGLIRLRELAKQ